MEQVLRKFDDYLKSSPSVHYIKAIFTHFCLSEANCCIPEHDCELTYFIFIHSTLETVFSRQTAQLRFVKRPHIVGQMFLIIYCNLAVSRKGTIFKYIDINRGLFISPSSNN